ncbi:hypothetical protein D3C87_1947620 [compost metagenome]
MQNLEILADVSLGLRIGEMDLMHPAAGRATLEAPEDGEALAGGGRGSEVLAEIEEALEIPVELVEPVLAQGRPRSGGARHDGSQAGGEDHTARLHGETPSAEKS